MFDRCLGMESALVIEGSRNPVETVVSDDDERFKEAHRPTIQAGHVSEGH